MGKQMVEVVVERARVTLVGAATYKLGGKKFIKDLPKIVKGNEIHQYKMCAYFSVASLSPKVKKVEASTVKKGKKGKKKKVTDSTKKKKDKKKKRLKK